MSTPNICFYAEIRIFPEVSSNTEYICFVCVEVLRSGQTNGVTLSAVSLPNHTFTGQV